LKSRRGRDIFFDIERFFEEKMNPLYRAHYALWVYWWPLWRRFSGQSILQIWDRCNLVQEKQTFLDYGCGTGDFTIHAARKVTEEGKVYALDYFPRQLQIVKKRAEKAGVSNIETIHSESATGLPDKSVDIIWMCDVLHEIKERKTVLNELHRVLKNDGYLAIHDGMGKKVLAFTEHLFSLSQTDKNFLLFTKNY